jgi:hypothetical protein
MQLSKIIIGQLAIIIVVIGMVIFIGDGVLHYPNEQSSGYNSTGFDKIEAQYQSLNSTINEARDKTENTSSLNPLANFIDIYFGGGLKAIRVAVSGVQITNTIVDVSVDETIGNYEIGRTVKLMVSAMIVVALFIGILLYVILGRERL